MWNGFHNTPHRMYLLIVRRTFFAFMPHAFHATCICMLAPIPGHMQIIQALFCICNRMSHFHFFEMHPNHSRTFTFCYSVNLIRIYLQHSLRCRSDTIASDLRSLPAASSTPLWLRQKVMSVPCLTSEEFAVGDRQRFLLYVSLWWASPPLVPWRLLRIRRWSLRLSRAS